MCPVCIFSFFLMHFLIIHLIDFLCLPTSKKLEGYIGFGLHPSVIPFVTLFDACQILRTISAKVLKFNIWIPHEKRADLYFFSCLSYVLFWSYAPLKKKSEWNLVSKISQKSIWARNLKLDQLIGDDENITWLTFEQIQSVFKSYGPSQIWTF